MNTEGNWLKSFVPNWNEVNLTENSAERVYEIALINPENIFVASTAVNVKNIDKFKEKSLLKLIVIENKESHKFSAAIMEFAAFEANNLSLSQLRYKNYRTFSGAVNFYKINGQLANGWIYKEGKLMAKTESGLNLGLSNINTVSGGKGKLMLADAGSLACGTRSVAHWRKVCFTIGEVDGWGYSGSGTTTSCRWEVYHTTEAIYCQALESVEDAFGGFEGGGSIGGGEVDCAGVPNGTAYQTDCGCIGGSTGITVCPLEIKADSLQKYFPCMVKEVLDKLLANQTYGKLIQPFQSIKLPNGSAITIPGLPNLTFGFSSQPYGGSSGDYMLGNTKQIGSTASSTIEFNSAAINNASKLFLQITAIHEVAHAYATYYIKAGYWGKAVNIITYPTWGMNIVNFDAANKAQQNTGNLTDHSLFLENYVDNFVNILREMNGNSYTSKEYQMAAIYGLDNAGSMPANFSKEDQDLFNKNKIILEKSYSILMNKFGITSAEKNAFYAKNLINVPSIHKLNCPPNSKMIE